MSAPDSLSFPAPADDGLRMPRRAVAVGAITLAAILSVLDGSMLNVALPLISAETGMSPAASVWLLNAYQLTIVASLLPLAAAGERVGYARVFRLGLLLFTLGALACAFAPDARTLVSARIVQGLGSGCIMSSAAALLRAAYPARLFATGLGINTMAVTLAAAAGSALSSAILAVAHWRWLFSIALPAGTLAWFCAFALPATPRRPTRLDLPSMALNVAALSLTVIGLDRLGAHPATGLAVLLAAAAAWQAWIRRDARRSRPLLPLDLFAIVRFRLSIFTSLLMFATQMASLIALPFHFHGDRGLTLPQAALLLTAWPIGATVTTFFASRLLARFGAATLCATAAIVMVAGLSWILLAPDHLFLLLAPGLALGGIAVGLFQAPNTHDMLSSPPRDRVGAAGGMQAIARVGGQSLGATLAGIGLAQSDRIGPTLAIAFAMGLALMVLAVNLRRRRLLPAMERTRTMARP